MYLKYINLFDFWTFLSHRSFRVRNWTICVKSEIRWSEFYEGKNWLETKIGRENNVDLNRVERVWISNFSAKIKGGREEVREGRERKLDSKEFETRPFMLFFISREMACEETNRRTGLIVVTRKNIASEQTPRFNAGKYHFFHFSTSGD